LHIPSDMARGASHSVIDCEQVHCWQQVLHWTPQQLPQCTSRGFLSMWKPAVLLQREEHSRFLHMAKLPSRFPGRVSSELHSEFCTELPGKWPRSLPAGGFHTCKMHGAHLVGGAQQVSACTVGSKFCIELPSNCPSALSGGF